jgi:membrane fusion protein, peptide pheromone/bacteriocin exporter
MDLIPFSSAGNCLEGYFASISSRSRIIYWIIIGSILTALSLLPFIYVDVSVQARGFFQSVMEKQVVYTPFQGKVIFTSIRNGSRVTKGDTLFIIDSETIRTRQAALSHAISENNSSVKDLEILTKIDYREADSPPIGLLTRRYMAEFANLKSQHSIQFQKYIKKKTEHERNELLFTQKIIPGTDYENSLFLLSSEKDNLDQIWLQHKSLWESDLAIRKIDAVNLFSDFEQCTQELNNRIILAPAGGEIIQSADIQTGSIVSPGQKIAELSPDGDLVATCFVKPADIGLIRENQDVKIQVDAFNYNEWGMLYGNIIDISDDMIMETGSTVYFRVKCKPDRTCLSLKNGHTAYIKKGMSINTRIILTRRSLFNLLFDKAGKWFNPYAGKPS